VDRTINHPSYEAQEGDIAVAAVIEVIKPDGNTETARPVYLIRGNQPFSLKDELPDLGLHFRFENIDPATGTLTIGVAEADASMRKIPMEIAENAARSDYIVLEAIVFPGINYVWLGSLLMLVGLAMGLAFRMRMK
jgi:cytochrome c-type biogenesis protein CcmF